MCSSLTPLLVFSDVVVQRLLLRTILERVTIAGRAIVDGEASKYMRLPCVFKLLQHDEAMPGLNGIMYHWQGSLKT
ncbi:hypothetical protein HaLaN_26680 [Haematococcus lacustris]|uniref:Uncharacterized protein n=1 Tax=Haematococcus lacustris TaxID=44745 RepID=A0A6A0A6S6_HAELA|nr:hypothetical protein HaLaN_26680 [Haematococcus lacustris]